jgi:hypothetical protein
MKIKTLYTLLLLATSLIATQAYANPECELPSDVDDGEDYWIKFKNQKPLLYHLENIDECWVEVQINRGSSKDTYWYPVTDIESISPKKD